MKKHLAIAILLGTLVSTLFAGLRPIKLTDAWKSKIRKLAPAKATVKPAKDRKVLVFSLSPGFKHWCIPHTAAVVEILGEKTVGAEFDYFVIGQIGIGHTTSRNSSLVVGERNTPFEDKSAVWDIQGESVVRLPVALLTEVDTRDSRRVLDNSLVLSRNSEEGRSEELVGDVVSPVDARPVY